MINQFKQAVMQALFHYLTNQGASKPERFLFATHTKHPNVCIQLTPSTWKTLDSLPESCRNEIDHLSYSAKPAVAAIIRAVVQKEQAYHLWRQLHHITQVMPGAWKVFSSVKPLKMALLEALKEYPLYLLKEADDTAFKERITALLAKIEALVETITQLKSDCQHLKQELDTKTQLVVNELPRLKEQLLMLEELNATYLTALDNSNFKNEQQLETITRLEQQNVRLVAELENLTGIHTKNTEPQQTRLTTNKRVSTATNNQLIGGNSQDIASRQNREYANSRSSRLSWLRRNQDDKPKKAPDSTIYKPAQP